MTTHSNIQARHTDARPRASPTPAVAKPLERAEAAIWAATLALSQAGATLARYILLNEEYFRVRVQDEYTLDNAAKKRSSLAEG